MIFGWNFYWILMKFWCNFDKKNLPFMFLTSISAQPQLVFTYCQLGKYIFKGNHIIITSVHKLSRSNEIHIFNHLKILFPSLFPYPFIPIPCHSEWNIKNDIKNIFKENGTEDSKCYTNYIISNYPVSLLQCHYWILFNHEIVLGGNRVAKRYFSSGIPIFIYKMSETHFRKIQLWY